MYCGIYNISDASLEEAAEQLVCQVLPNGTCYHPSQKGYALATLSWEASSKSTANMDTDCSAVGTC